MKNMFNKIFKGSIELLHNRTLNIFLPAVRSKNTFLNLGSLFFLVLIFYYFYKAFFIGRFSIVVSLISFIVSFLISTYVLDNFKYSNNVIIK